MANPMSYLWNFAGHLYNMSLSVWHWSWVFVGHPFWCWRRWKHAPLVVAVVRSFGPSNLPAYGFLGNVVGAPL